ncbi:hypothetical protein PMAYCL1PPCAC_26716, partial [Pristionchus mayeri]
ARLTPSEILLVFSISMLTLESVAYTLQQEQRSEPPSFMKDYMSRGMLQCTLAYTETIGEIQKLIKKAYLEHMKCKEEMENADKTYPKFDFDIIDNLMEGWQEEDAAQGAQPEKSSLPPSPSTTSTESPLSRRKRTHRPTH